MNQQGERGDPSWLSLWQARGGDIEHPAQGYDDIRPPSFKPSLEHGFVEEEDPPDPTKWKTSFELKLSFYACIIFLYPVIMLAILNCKPSVRYWVGHGFLWATLAVPIWLFCCHMSVTLGVLRRGLAPVYILMVPAAWLVLLCEIQANAFASAGTWLRSDDCTTYAPKVRMQEAWGRANVFHQNCTWNLAQITGAGLDETAQLLDIKSCPGYDEAARPFIEQWRYLEGVEKYQVCGGWCSRRRPIWTTRPTQDSCSIAVAQEISDGIRLMGFQLTVYCIIVLMGSSLVLIASPSWMPTV